MADMEELRQQMLALSGDFATLKAENNDLKQAMAVKVGVVDRKVEAGERSATSSRWVRDLKNQQVKDEFRNPA